MAKEKLIIYIERAGDSTEADPWVYLDDLSGINPCKMRIRLYELPRRLPAAVITGLQITSFIRGLEDSGHQVSVRDKRTAMKRAYAYQSGLPPTDLVCWFYGYAWATGQWVGIRAPLWWKIQPAHRAAVLETTAQYYWDRPTERRNLRVIL